MSNKNYAPVCGIYCGNCDFLGKQCRGCGVEKGKPFWTTEIHVDVCPLHSCCFNQKKMEHCGLCSDFPCAIFLELRDPGMSDEEFQKSLAARQEALRRRAETGTEKWLAEIMKG